MAHSWIIFGLLASLLSAALPLVQERYNASGYALAFAIKIVTLLVALPAALAFGLPTDPVFYVYLFATAILYCVSDVVYYRTVGEVGAGVVSRLLPATTIATFLLWLAFMPELLDRYQERPEIAGGIFLTVCGAVWCAMRLKKCPVSWQAAKSMWVVLVAATFGPILTKQALAHAPAASGVMGYTAIQAAMMLGLWSAYGLRKGLRLHVPADKRPALLRAGLFAGIFSALCVICKNAAYGDMENPAYLSVLMYLDTVWVLLFYRWKKRPDASDIAAGMGMVACAAALVILKSL